VSERTYDPSFSSGLSRQVTIMDVAREHAMMTAHCGCSICWMSREISMRDAEKAEAVRQRALTERLMKEWP
jgi:hypothetical protein